MMQRASFVVAGIRVLGDLVAGRGIYMLGSGQGHCLDPGQKRNSGVGMSSSSENPC